MRKLVLILLLLFIGSNSFASHLVGGSLGYEYLGQFGAFYRYKLILTVYNNCDSSSNVPVPVATQNVGVYPHDIPNNPMGGGNKTLLQTVTLNIVDSNEVTPPISSLCPVGGTVCISSYNH